MLKKQEVEPGSPAIFAQVCGVAEQFSHGSCHGDNLLPALEGVEPNCQVRIGGKPATHPNRKPDFILAIDLAFTPAVREIDGKNEVGFSVRVGGGLSTDPHLAVRLNALVRWEQVVPV